MYKRISECGVDVLVPAQEKVSRELPVFYNPVMALNRDISVAVLNTVKRPLQVALPLAGTGVRAVRFLAGLKGLKSIHINDINPDAIDIIKKNLELSRGRSKMIKANQDVEVTVHNQDANTFLMSSKGFDYIDIDPFGSPNPFLENSIKRLARKGMLAVTATDTGALSGTFPKACKRKYWARPLKNELMHEIGLRILIRKVQLVGAQNDKALTPILSYSKDHYMRIFFSCEKSKEKTAGILESHKYLLYCPSCMDKRVSAYNSGACSCGKSFDFAGPLWAGKLQDKGLTKKVKDDFVQGISRESDSLFFYDVHAFARKLKLRSIKKTDDILRLARKKDKDASLTHIRPNCIKTDIGIKEFAELVG